MTNAWPSSRQHILMLSPKAMHHQHFLYQTIMEQFPSRRVCPHFCLAAAPKGLVAKRTRRA
eukprot:1746494-Karenia_brevis.AAC.1